MIKVSVCFSRKERDEFVSCSIGEIELDARILDDVIAFRDCVKTAYERCVNAVDIQLGGPTAAAPASPPASPSSVAPPTPPSPLASRNASGSGLKEGAPMSARELGGWAKRHGVTKWFTEFGRAQKPALPGLLSEWSDEWAVWAYQQWLASQSAVPQSNGNGRS